MRVLYVDDHTPYRAVVQRKFLASHEVVPAASLAEARDRLAHGTFDAVLVEEKFPDGDGADLVRELVASGSGCLVIAVSASPQSTSRLMAAGAGAAISKSEFTRLAARLEEIMRP